MRKNNKILKLVIILISIFFIASSASQAMIKTQNIYENLPPAKTTNEDIYFNWSDEFTSEQWIESTQSWDYLIENGEVTIKDTYEIWTDPSWTKMVPIKVDNTAGKDLQNIAIHVDVIKDSDMQNDYGDIRFKHDSYTVTWLDQWIENKDPDEADIWVNIPELPKGESYMYLFYGNPSADEISNFHSVFSDWTPNWENDLKASTHVYTEGAWDPDVAYGETSQKQGRFLVVWEEGQAPNPPYTYFFKQDIRGSIYDTNGDPIYEDFTIRSGQEPQWHHEDPTVAFGDGKYLVAWVHYGTSTDPETKDILGRFVTLDGTVSQTDIIICEETGIQGLPCTVFDTVNNRWCVVWEDARQGQTNYNLYAKFVTPDGQVSSEKIISTAANNQRQPWIAYDKFNQQYMIVWEEKPPGNQGYTESDIWMGLFDKNMNPLPGNNPKKITNSNENVRYLFPAVAFSEESQRYLITFNEGTPDKAYRGDVWGKIVDTSGNNIGSTMFKIKDGDFIRTDVVPYLNTAFLVAFNGGGNIWGKFIICDEQEDVSTQDIQLSASTSAEADWVNLATDENEIFVTWEDARIDYIAPFNGVPDVYCNMWYLNFGDSKEILLDKENEKQILLSAQITTKELSFENFEQWHKFYADYDGTITYDVLDSNYGVLIGDVSPLNGADISSITQDKIRLRAKLTRDNPSYTPVLRNWELEYVGSDDEPPLTFLDHIDGTKENNDIYTDQSVTIYLTAEDYPPKFKSGVKAIYYTVNRGEVLTYKESGIILQAPDTNYWGEWYVRYWSEDNAGNVDPEKGDDNERMIHILIDAENPSVTILEPADEQKVTVPFWVRVDATDNYGIERVEFDIEPFGKRDNMPYKDYEPPYEWYCDVGEGTPKTLSLNPQPLGTGVNRMLRARIVDKAGQIHTHEIWIHVTNWNRFPKTKSYTPLITPLKLGFKVSQLLDLQIPTPNDADKMIITAKNLLGTRTSKITDDDLSDGCHVLFNLPTGFYKITTTAYKDDEEISTETYARILFLKRLI